MPAESTVYPASLALRDAASDTVAMVGQALGVSEASVRVALPDSAGRLRVVAAQGPKGAVGRRRSSRRRQVFRTGESVAIDIAEDGSVTLSILPLKAEDRTIGVLEVVAPREQLDGRRDAILALVRQSAALLRVSQERELHDRSTRGMERLLALATALERAPGPVAAMAAVADACHDHLGAATIVVRPERDGAGWFLAGAAGIGDRVRGQLRRALRLLGRGNLEAQHGAVEAVFRSCVAPAAMTLPAGEALVVVGIADERSGFAKVAALMLGRTLAYLTGRDGVTPRDVGVGMAWTAHELRGPLAGAKAALEQVLSGNPTPERLELLRRTKTELEHLTELVDPLLEWSAGPHRLRFDRADLVEVVRESVASTTFDADRERIVVEAPSRLPILADAPQLRVAVGNLVRNALAYAPRSTDVRVVVEDFGEVARVYVRDLGPGIPPEERRAIFDPFVRGAEARSARVGKGLGLFIARRVAEAHGGTVRLEPSEVGAAFCLEIPVGQDTALAAPLRPRAVSRPASSVIGNTLPTAIGSRAERGPIELPIASADR